MFDEKQFSDISSEYLLRNSEAAEKKRRRQLIFLLLPMLYVVILGGYLGVKSESLLTSFFGPKTVLSNDTELADKVAALDKKYESMQESLKNIEVAGNNPSQAGGLALLNKQISDIEVKQRALEETILVDAEKAITSKVLLERQDGIKEGLKEAKEISTRLNERIDNIVLGAFIIPILTALVAYLGSFLLPKRVP